MAVAATTLSLSGDKALIRALRDLPGKVEKRVVKKALNAGAKVMIPVARSYASSGGQRPTRQTGSLVKAIGLRRVREKKGRGTFLVTVGPRYQRRIVREIGSVRSRKVRTKIASAKESKAILGFLKDGKKTRKVPGITITNPGKYAFLVEFGHGGKRPAPAKPFMRPAFEATKSKVSKVITDMLWRGIQQEARKMASKGKV